MSTNTTDPDTSAQAQNPSVTAPEPASEPAAAPIAAATDTDTTVSESGLHLNDFAKDTAVE